MTKYVLFLADFHCGSLVGLTPPEWHYRFSTNTGKRMKLHRIALQLWETFDKLLKELPPLDCIVICGDMVEGKGKRSGGTELLTSTMKIQCDMAVGVIERVRKQCKNSAKIFGVYGTNYHVATDGDDWEDLIADQAFFTKIGAHEWITINGVTFDIKHKISTSSIPHGRGTALLREMLWNDMWAVDKMQPKSDVVIRAHAHYYMSIETSRKRGIILAPLQGMGSKFGARECSGTVDWGFVLYEIKDNGEHNAYPYIRNIEAQKAKAVKL